MIQFLGPIASLAGTWLEGKVEEKKAVAGAKIARAKAEATIAEKQATGEIDYDLIIFNCLFFSNNYL